MAPERSRAAQYGWAIAVVLAATALNYATRSLLDLADHTMLFLAGVVVVAMRFSRGPSLVATVASVAALDFFFVPPYFTFDVENLRYVVTFGVMLVVGIVVSRLTHRLREEGEAAERSRIGIETERARTTLLAGISHDVRTPLASITGAVSVLLETGDTLPPAERRGLLEAIREEGRRLDRLVADLLDLTRLESGVKVKKEWVPLEEVVGSAIARLQSRLESRDLDVRLPDDVLLVPVDPVLLEQVLVNLLENAVKYSPPGSPLRVEGGTRGADVELEVSDRGDGIPPGEEARVFERFYRIADGGRAEGTGLGLAVCQAIVRAHGGRIAAEPREGGGATFRISLPLGGGPKSVAEIEAKA